MGSNVRAELTSLLGTRTAPAYTRVPTRFICRGLNLTSPVDNLPDGKYPFLKNVRAYRDFLQPRPGLVEISTQGGGSGAIVTHTVRRLNDETVPDFERIMMSGTRLISGGFVREISFSGNPVTMLPIRPRQSPRPWMYVGDTAKMAKTRTDGLTHQIGLDPPTNVPVAQLARPDYKDIDDFDYANDAALQAAWIEGGVAGNPTLLSRVSTTITTILYDNLGDEGWAVVEPADETNIQEGMRIRVNSGGGSEELVTVQSVSAAATATTIDRIIYDVGSTGFASIVFATPVEGIKRDSLLLLGGAEHTRVVSAVIGPDGTRSVRVFLGTTRVATDAVVTKNSFRAYFDNTHVATETLTGSAMRSTFAFTDVGTVGTLTRTVTQDLSFIVAGLTTQRNDIFHVSIRFADINLVSEGRILIDISDGTFSKDVLIFPFRPDDLVPAIAGDSTFVTTRDTVVTRAVTGEITNQDAQGRISDLADLGFDIGLLFPGVDIQRQIEETQSGRLFQKLVFENPEHFRQLAIDRGLISDTDLLAPGQAQIATGDDSWQELTFRVKDMIRVGTDLSKGLKDAAAFRVEILSDDETSLTVDVDSWWLGGGKGPEVGQTGFPYTYRYRSRVSQTGAVSNNSPVIRNGVEPRRQEVNIGLPGINTPTFTGTEEVDRLDVSRFGGNLLEWHYVGTAENFRPRIITDATNASPIVVTITTPPAMPLVNGDFIFIEGVNGNLNANGFWEVAAVTATTFELVGSSGSGAYTSGGSLNPAFKDNLRDETVAVNPNLPNDNFRPFPTVGQPQTGTTTAVAGTTVQDSGANFDLTWAPGTIIHLDGIPFSIYKVISTSLLEIARNAGSLGAVRWDVFEPVQEGVPLLLFGPFEGYTFGVGDPDNPGVLYFTKQNEPDATTETHKIEITSPSEPLMNGVVYNGRAYVWSSERMFALYHAFGEPQLFRTQEVPNGKGMFSRWALAVGPKIWFMAKDGIYETEGSEPRSITDGDLYPLFPHEGQSGEDTNGIPTPDFTQDEKLRLAYYDKYLYFDYRLPDDTSRTLVYDTRWDGWFYDEYLIDGDLRGVVMHYGEEGLGVHSVLVGSDNGGLALDELLLQLTGQADHDGVDILGQIRTASYNEGDPRARKRYGDVYVEGDSENDSIDAEVALDEHSRIVGVKTFDHDIRDDSVVDINDGKGELGRNLSLDLSWASMQLIKFFLWERSVLARPPDVLLRGEDYSDAGEPGDKFFQGILIEADTKGADRQIQVQFDNDQDGPLLTVNHDGRIRKPFSFETPFHAHQVRLLPKDAAEWRLFSFDWIWEPSPELVKFWQTQPTSHGLTGYQHLKAVQLAIEATSDVLLTVNFDGVERSVTVNATGGELLKRYKILPVMKAKVFSYRVESTVDGEGFRLYLKDCEVKVKEWDSAEEYQTARPFGGESFRVGARI